MTDEQARVREALKLVAVAFKDVGIPFALAGGYALWARGAPEPHHDVDFVVAEDDRGSRCSWTAPWSTCCTR